VADGIAFIKPEAVIETAHVHLSWRAVWVIPADPKLKEVTVRALEDQMPDIKKRIGAARLPYLPGERIHPGRIRDQLDGNALGQFFHRFPARTLRAPTTPFPPVAARPATEVLPARPPTRTAFGARTPRVTTAFAKVATRTAPATRAAATARATALAISGIFEVGVTIGRLGLSCPGGKQLEVKVQFDFGLVAHGTTMEAGRIAGWHLRAAGTDSLEGAAPDLQASLKVLAN
jgi:hypothetical protein